MATEKKIKGVIIPRHDTAKNWAKAVNFIPNDGELIIYSKDSAEDLSRGYYLNDGGTRLDSVSIGGKNYPVVPSDVVRFKFGNGTDNVNVLPFATTDVDLTTYQPKFATASGTTTRTLNLDGTTTYLGKGTTNKLTFTSSGVTANGNFYISSTPTTDTHGTNKKYVDEGLTGKVDKVSGKGLSTNDFTTAYKNKLDNAAGQTTAEGGEIFNLYEDTDVPLAEILGQEITQRVPKNKAGEYGHAEGVSTQALGQGSHSEGAGTLVTGAGAHAEGRGVSFKIRVFESVENSNGIEVRSINSSPILGQQELNSIKKNAVIWRETNSDTHTGKFYYVVDATASLGVGTITLDRKDTFTENEILTVIMGGALSHISHTEGNYCNTLDIEATNLYSNEDNSKQRQHAEGNRTLAIGYASHTEGDSTLTLGTASHAEGNSTKATGTTAHSEGYGTEATGDYSHSGGYGSKATGWASVAEGNNNTASGSGSHAEGRGTNALAEGAHSEGILTNAEKLASHAEGYQTTALGDYSHAEGYGTKAGWAAHAEGDSTQATGSRAHAEGGSTCAEGKYSHAEGNETAASGDYSHAEGKETTASGDYSHAEGYKTLAGSYSHAEGGETSANGDHAHAEGTQTHAIGSAAHAEGSGSYAEGEAAHAEGAGTKANGNYSHSEGYKTEATEYHSHAEGDETLASGRSSHAEGHDTTASGDYSHAEGYQCIASGDYSHAEGYQTQATEDYAHAEGRITEATGTYSHAEGLGTKATNKRSHAEGYYTKASGEASHAGGCYTVAGYNYQTVIGKYNKNKSNTLFEIGNGTDQADSKRSNAFEVYSDSHVELPNLKNINGELDSTAIGDSDFAVATKGYVDNKFKFYESEDEVPTNLPEGTIVFILE